MRPRYLGTPAPMWRHAVARLGSRTGTCGRLTCTRGCRRLPPTGALLELAVVVMSTVHQCAKWRAHNPARGHQREDIGTDSTRDTGRQPVQCATITHARSRTCQTICARLTFVSTQMHSRSIAPHSSIASQHMRDDKRERHIFLKF